MARRRLHALATVVFGLWATSYAAAFAEAVDWKDGALGHLSEHIGTHNYQAILHDEIVARELRRLLGDDIDLLHDRLVVHSPIGFSGTCIALHGNAPRKGGGEMAYLSMCPRTGDIAVALAADGHVEVYASTTNYSHLDHGVRQWISHYFFNANGPHGTPDSVQLLTR